MTDFKMTSEEFLFWLKGYFSALDIPTKDQWVYLANRIEDAVGQIKQNRKQDQQ